MNTETKKPKSLRWFEPGWSFRPRLKREFSETIQSGMLPRIVAVVVLLTVLAAYYLKRAMPDLEFDWAGKLALSIGAFVLGLPCIYGVSWLIPPIIGINEKGVARNEGHVSWWRRADIRRITIDTTDPARPRLNIEATGKKPFECGIAGKVSAASLADFLRATFPELAVEEKN